MGWVEWLGFGAFVVACDQAFAWMERRGWIYWRGRPSGALDRTDPGGRESEEPPGDRGSRAPVPRSDDLVFAHARQDWPVLRADQSAGEALDVLRLAADLRGIDCLYVVDLEDRLGGVVAIRRLLSCSDPVAPASSIMSRDVVSLPGTATIEAAADAFRRHRVVAIPIVDDRGRLIGVVDIAVVARERAARARRLHGLA